ncbi:hypothetical protein HMPREF0971_00075 [Segatella oris F0302]|uniref:Uncharacterized protein n=1 Tax=Segatella oris F0302 TaxID=649760 RepID=D1QMR7_9BACT|nr:hypothetical protein HMPREF0971_00075 [Segatella oris F0302]
MAVFNISKSDRTEKEKQKNRCYFMIFQLSDCKSIHITLRFDSKHVAF